jgi:hypothetical protein
MNTWQPVKDFPGWEVIFKRGGVTQIRRVGTVEIFGQSRSDSLQWDMKLGHTETAMFYMGVRV